jgi:hypothetical protein
MFDPVFGTDNAGPGPAPVYLKGRRHGLDKLCAAVAASIQPGDYKLIQRVYSSPIANHASYVELYIESFRGSSAAPCPRRSRRSPDP